MKKIIFIGIVFFCCYSARAQEPPVTTQQQLENVAEALEEESPKDDNYLQLLDFYSREPINLNTATAEELQPLRMMTDLQIYNLLHYRKLLGNFISIYELQAVPTLDLQTIRQVTPYVYVGPSGSAATSLLSRFRGGDQHVLGRITRVLEKSKGYDTGLNTHYLGDRNHVLLRYRYQFKNLLQFGFLADKDAGEQFFKGAQQQGFDFYSAHFFVRNLGSIKSLAVGDYLVNFGQGLIQWQSMGFGKSSEVLSLKRQSPALMPYRSAGEFYFNRGAAVTLSKGRWDATAFFSTKKFSGNFIADTTERFSSFQVSGYYRTPSEIADRYNINDVSVGGSLALQESNFKVAVNTVRHQFSLPLQKRADAYNYFAPTGTIMWNSSVDFSFTHKNLHLFGEAAADKDLNPAAVAGALISADPKVDLSFFYRNISKKYQSFFGNAFTENTLPSNETGFYSGFNFRPVHGWRLSAYADFFQFPFLRYRVHAPTRGSDYLVQLTYVPNKQSEIYARFRNKNKPINESNSTAPVNFPVDQVKKNFRLHFAAQVSPVLNLRSRVELVWLEKRSGEELGFLTYVEGRYKPGFKFSGNLRLQYFETGGYDSRIYTYENDVLYSFSIPAFFDKGFRYYFNLNYDFNKYLSVWLRLSQTVYPSKTLVGSGLDAINGNKKTEGKFQFVWQF